MSIRALDIDLDPASFRPHALHSAEREWTETNCYIDMWIELLAVLGFDPVAAAVCTLSSDFEGDQWTMFKFEAHDLWRLFGIEVAELNVWRPLVDHLVEQLSFGRPLSVDVDAWYLPDTEGVSYKLAHQKTTVAAQMVDPDRRRLGYFHNAGYYELDGDDFEGMLIYETEGESARLPPYTEVIKLERLAEHNPGLDIIQQLVIEHLARRPSENPLLKFQHRVKVDLTWLAERDIATFHRYAFGTCRQCGANAELAAAFVDWLGRREGGDLTEVAAAFRSISDGAKWLQFLLARVQRGRTVDFDDRLQEMADAWDFAMAALAVRYGC